MAGAVASKAKAPVRECGVKDQVSWARRRWIGSEETGFTYMKRNFGSRALPAIAAGLAAATLAGCSVGPVNLPDIDLSSVTGRLGIVTTSVADAEAAIRAAWTCPVESAELVEPGYLTVGLPADNIAPLLVAKSDGTHAGMDVDVAYAIGDQVGLPVKFVTVADAQSAVGVSCDVVMGVAGTSQAAAVVGDYAETAVGVFARGGQASVAAADLAGKTVGIQLGSVSEKTLSAANLGCVEQPFTSTNEAMAALGAGTVDYVVCDAYSGSYLASDYEDVTLVGTLDAPATVGVAVGASRTTLYAAVQSAVEAVQSNGQLELIKADWANGVGTLTSASKLQGLA